ncbi:MAG: winged helix-turn-helix transcriptional regulator [Promethearchaeota archaeon]
MSLQQKSLLILFFSIFLLMIVISSIQETLADDGDENEFFLELQASTTQVAINSNITNIEITARLIDSESRLFEDNETFVEFTTNGSTFIENSDNEIEVRLEEGIAVVHLQKASVVTTAMIKAEISSIDIESVVFIKFQDEFQDENYPLISDTPNSFMNLLEASISRIFLSQNNLPPLLIVLSLITTLSLIFLALRKRVAKVAEDRSLNWLNRLQMALLAVVAIVTQKRKREIDQDEVLDNSYRQKILNLLETQRIMHLRELQRMLNCGMSILLWHLEVLEEFGLVKHEKFGHYIAYYSTSAPPTREDLLTYFALLNPTSRQIIETLSENPEVSARQLQAMTNIQIRLIRYHLRKQIDVGIINVKRENKASKFSLNPEYAPYIRKKIEISNLFLQYEEEIQF